jgi:hypothetical protein
MLRMIALVAILLLNSGCVDSQNQGNRPTPTPTPTPTETKTEDQFGGETVGQECARSKAALLFGEGGWSSKNLTDQVMTECRTNRAEASYGVSLLRQANWTSEAAKFALGLTRTNRLLNPSRSELVSVVVFRGGFTQAEAEAGVDSNGRDWNRNAADAAMEMVAYTPYRLDLMDALIRNGFTQAEAEAGLALIGCIQMRCDGG